MFLFWVLLLLFTSSATHTLSGSGLKERRKKKFQKHSWYYKTSRSDLERKNIYNYYKIWYNKKKYIKKRNINMRFLKQINIYVWFKKKKKVCLSVCGTSFAFSKGKRKLYDLKANKRKLKPSISPHLYLHVFLHSFITTIFSFVYFFFSFLGFFSFSGWMFN